MTNSDHPFQSAPPILALSSTIKRHEALAHRWHRLALLVALAGLAGVAQAQAVSACGPLANAYGPFDYRRVKGESLAVVERHHFTPNIETLVSGNTGTIGGELNYTLRAFPNHHRALVAIMRLGEKVNSDTPRDTVYPVECFFIRALTFQPDDVVARMLYVKFLITKKRKADAMNQLEATEQITDDYGFTYYNMGLLYMELDEPKLALGMAHRAQTLGFSRPELKQLLETGGHWREQATDRPDAPASSPAKG